MHEINFFKINYHFNTLQVGVKFARYTRLGFCKITSLQPQTKGKLSDQNLISPKIVALTKFSLNAKNQNRFQ